MINWHVQAWEDYLYWQKKDKRILKRISALIKDISREPFTRIVKPEPLKHNWRGFWSRRINDEHRLVYTVQNGDVIIAQCRYHYDK